MSILVDGSNLLGKLGWDRHGVDSKRELTRRLSAVARVKRTSILCFFDGSMPETFARQLGPVRVEFTGSRPADDLIAERARSAKDRTLQVVTSDAGLAARVSGRRVAIVRCEEFIPLLESAAGEGEEAPVSDDWRAYFSDPKNRFNF